MSVRRTKQLYLLVGDIIIFFCSLWIALSIRNGNFISNTDYEHHIPYFIVICILYIILQYIVGTYDIGKHRTQFIQLRALSISSISTFLLSSLFFYLLINPNISPKTILFLTIFIASIGSYTLQAILNKVSTHTKFFETIGIIGNPNNHDINELILRVQSQPEISVLWIHTSPTTEHLQSVQTIVFHNEFFSSEPIKKLLYTQVVGKKQILTFSELYESVCKKIPTESVTTDWFITHVQADSVMYERIKTLFDYLFGIILFVLFILCIIPVSLLISTTSIGPIFIKQTRIGKSGRHFLLYKFRTMYALAPDGSAETAGAVFSTKGDTRITPIGKFLRKTRIDELPQAINVLRRDISIIGPRPERPEIVDNLIAEAPYFSTRTIVMPGITGWAAVHQHYTDTKESTIEKLQYDLYYIKHRSIWIDIKIILLTIRTILDMKGQ